MFPFGHGLSYSTFEYSNLRVPCTTVTEKGIVGATVDITNTSMRQGAEVAMLFVKGPAAAPGTPGAARAVKELKSFNRVELDPMTGKRIPPRARQDLRHWQVERTGLGDRQGEYKVLAGRTPETGGQPGRRGCWSLVIVECGIVGRSTFGHYGNTNRDLFRVRRRLSAASSDWPDAAVKAQDRCGPHASRQRRAAAEPTDPSGGAAAARFAEPAAEAGPSSTTPRCQTP